MPSNKKGSVAFVSSFLPKSEEKPPPKPKEKPPPVRLKPQGSVDAALHGSNEAATTPLLEKPVNSAPTSKVKQGSISANKLRPPLIKQPKKLLDAETLISLAKIKIPLPKKNRVNNTKYGSIHCLKNLLMPKRVAVEEESDDEDEEASSATGHSSLKQQPAAGSRSSALSSAKAKILPGRPDESTADTPPVPVKRAKGKGNDLFETAPGESLTLAKMCGIVCNLPFIFIASPPFAGIKLILTFPGLLMYSWTSFFATLPLGPLLPFVALGVCLPTLGLQCKAAAYPLAHNFCALFSELSDLIDGAFENLDVQLNDAVRKSISFLGLARAPENKVVFIVCRPAR